MEVRAQMGVGGSSPTVGWILTCVCRRVHPGCDSHKGFSEVNETEVDVFLEFSLFFYDSTDVGNLISGSSAFSKSSLNIWKCTVHVLLKPSMDNFEH